MQKEKPVEKFPFLGQIFSLSHNESGRVLKLQTCYGGGDDGRGTASIE